MKNLNLILGTISRLEDKRDNGTITMDESTYLNMLIELAEQMVIEL